MPDSHPGYGVRPHLFQSGPIDYLPPEGTEEEEVDLRLALMHLALQARARIVADLVDAEPTDIRTVLLAEDLRGYRKLLKEHAPTASGFCRTCRYASTSYYPQYPWPCPTVVIIETAIHALSALSDEDSGG